MPEHDYYKTLNVSREASDDEIRKSYKKLAREYHPDVKPDDKSAAEKFKQIQEAYSVLGDSEKREQYDRYGAAFQGAGRGPGGAPFNWAPGAGGAGPIDLSDILGGQFDLGDVFGQGGRGGGGFQGFGRGGQAAAAPQKGQNAKLEIEVPFLVAATGGNHSLQLQHNGKSVRINVKIPAGVDTGSVIRLPGEGHPGEAGGSAGDLMLTIKVAKHPYFQRSGNNLTLDVPVTPTEAALGAKVDVPTLTEGALTVTIPPGTSSGTKLRLRGKGVVDQKSKQPGDQIVAVQIIVPKQLDQNQRELYESLAEATPDSPRDGLW